VGGGSGGGGRVGGVDGLLAVDLQHAAVLHVADVLQLVEDVARLVLDQDGRVGRLEHAGGQLLGEHVQDERVQRVQAAELVRDVHAPRLIAVLQEEHTWAGEGRGRRVGGAGRGEGVGGRGPDIHTFNNNCNNTFILYRALKGTKRPCTW